MVSVLFMRSSSATADALLVQGSSTAECGINKEDRQADIFKVLYSGSHGRSGVALHQDILSETTDPATVKTPPCLSAAGSMGCDPCLAAASKPDSHRNKLKIKIKEIKIKEISYFSDG